MELDDFRRKWQTSAVGTTSISPVTTTALHAMLTHTPNSPVTRLLGSVRFEMISCWIGMGVGLLLLLLPDLYGRFMGGWTLLMSGLGLRYLLHKRQKVKQLMGHTATITNMLSLRLATLRQMLYRYRQSVYWTLPITFGIGLGIQFGKVYVNYTGQQLLYMMGGLLMGYVLITGVTFVLIRWLTQWYLQRLYGQYLDQLEAALRELEAGE